MDRSRGGFLKYGTIGDNRALAWKPNTPIANTQLFTKVIISDDKQILILDSDDSDYIYSEISDSDGGEDVTESDAGEAGDDITETYASSAYDTVLVEPDWECIKLEDISDKETEIISTTSVLESTSSKSRKRKDNSFVRDSMAKKARGN